MDTFVDDPGKDLLRDMKNDIQKWNHHWAGIVKDGSEAPARNRPTPSTTATGTARSHCQPEFGCEGDERPLDLATTHAFEDDHIIPRDRLSAEPLFSKGLRLAIDVLCSLGLDVCRQ